MRGSHFKMSCLALLAGGLIAIGTAIGTRAVADDLGAPPSYQGASGDDDQSDYQYGWSEEYGITGGDAGTEDVSRDDRPDDDPAAGSQPQSTGADDQYLYRYEYPEENAWAEDDTAASVDGEVESMEEYYYKYGYEHACPEESYSYSDETTGETDAAEQATDDLQETDRTENTSGQ